MRSFAMAVLALTVPWLDNARAEQPATTPRPVPLTRPEMKQLLEDMKARTPRIPLPDLTLEEKAKLGERGAGYESRLRYHYLPSGEGFGFGGGGSRGGATPREPDPNVTLTYKFKTELFWIVSRTNNCQYCMGHQESKLLRAGMSEDEIACLDFDWSKFTPAEQAAFAFARKFTYEPHLLNDSDIKSLQKHYKDLQILEMILSMAGNNAINRWKEGVGVPQSPNSIGFGRKSDEGPAKEPPMGKHSYLTPTSEQYREVITKVAPLQIDDKSQKPTKLAVCVRPGLESLAEVEKMLEACSKRTPRLPLESEEKARSLLSDELSKEPLPQWKRLLANFPKDGKSRITSVRNANEKGDLKPQLKAQVSWIIARQDRAWYSTGEAKRRLTEQGMSVEQIYKLDGDWAEFTPTERALFTVARKLAASPVVLTDEDVAKAVKLAGARDVVQLINYVTNRASFDRVTEAAGLQLEK